MNQDVEKWPNVTWPKCDLDVIVAWLLFKAWRILLYNLDGALIGLVVSLQLNKLIQMIFVDLYWDILLHFLVNINLVLGIYIMWYNGI